MKIMIKKEDFVRSGLWKLFPVINCDRCKDIPSDYPGAMGVPVTMMYHICKNDRVSGFELLDTVTPTVNGKRIYQRLIIRNLHPQIPNVFDLKELLEKYGSKYEIVVLRAVEGNREDEATDSEG